MGERLFGGEAGEGGGVETDCQLLWEAGEGGGPELPALSTGIQPLWEHPCTPRMPLGKESQNARNI